VDEEITNSAARVYRPEGEEEKRKDLASGNAEFPPGKRASGAERKATIGLFAEFAPLRQPSANPGNSMRMFCVCSGLIDGGNSRARCGCSFIRFTGAWLRSASRSVRSGIGGVGILSSIRRGVLVRLPQSGKKKKKKKYKKKRKKKKKKRKKKKKTTKKKNGMSSPTTRGGAFGPPYEREISFFFKKGDS